MRLDNEKTKGYVRNIPPCPYASCRSRRHVRASACALTIWCALSRTALAYTQSATTVCLQATSIRTSSFKACSMQPRVMAQCLTAR
eukprot:6209396-Pleurochrysis_carterae.AAC.1